MTRRPTVAGTFYEGSRESLIESIEECFLGRLGPGRLPETRDSRLGNVMGLVCPHAGYVYSGSAAAFGYEALAQDGAPDVAVILGPNHHGMGAAVSISSEDEWETPLGKLAVDGEIAKAICEGSAYVRQDDLAHIREHSIEVQLPFLQYIGGSRTKIVPISISHLGEGDAIELAMSLGGAIARALRGRSAVVIASTDFTHYESKSSAQAKDEMALREISRLNAKGLITTVYENSITMCGVIGTAVMIEGCSRLGARTARQLAYYTSGDVTGDFAQVVGYAAVSVER